MAGEKSGRGGIVVPLDRIARAILLIRGQKVMLDKDLAELYGVHTWRLNEQVKRNRERFPEDFMFSLNRHEILSISQIAISSTLKFAKNVNAFTEQGVTMLSSVLRSKLAIRANIQIMRTFTKLREMLLHNRDLKEKIDRLLEQQAVHRFGEFADITNVIDFFIRPESDFITGQVIYLGGI